MTNELILNGASPLHWAELNRTSIEITGNDRVKFLHNFCTADIKKLQPGELCEAFVLNLKGKLLGLVHVACHAAHLSVNTVSGQADVLMTHWNTFRIREQVAFRETTNELVWIFLFAQSNEGNAANSVVPQLASSWFQTVQFGCETIQLSRGEFAGPGWLLELKRDDRAKIFSTLAETNAVAATQEQLAAHRIRYRTPWYGVDADTETLPQEMQRDALAISFTKGCYLGQETVARIDAIGHVNRLLVCLRVSAPVDVALPVALTQNQKEVGKLTSAVWSELDSSHIALATIKRPLAVPAIIVEVASATAEVIQPIPTT